MLQEPLHQDDHLSESAIGLYAVEPLVFRALSMSDVPAFRALRLEALRLHPESFVPTYEEERAVATPIVASRVRDDWMSNGSFILGAYRGGELVGAAGVRRWTRSKQRHKATVWLLYIRADARQRGVGRQLLSAAIERCRQDTDIELLELSVGRESAAARRLYTSLGFQSYGVEPHSMKLGDRYIDVELMALRVGAPESFFADRVMAIRSS